jgi:hypothetical protein
MQPPVEPTVISSGEESSSEEEEEEAAPVAPTTLPIEVEDDNDDIWATVNEVAGGFAVEEEEEDPQAQPSPEQDSDLGEDEVSQAQQPLEVSSGSGEDSDNLSVPTRKVEVVISRNELDDDERAEYVDLTAGGDVVRRVLSEREDRDGVMEYAVEFEDYHVEEVRFACDFASPNTLYIFPQHCRLHLLVNINIRPQVRNTDQRPSSPLTTCCSIRTDKKHSTSSKAGLRRTRSPKQKQRPIRDDQAR